MSQIVNWKLYPLLAKARYESSTGELKQVPTQVTKKYYFVVKVLRARAINKFI